MQKRSCSIMPAIRFFKHLSIAKLTLLCFFLTAQQTWAESAPTFLSHELGKMASSIPATKINTDLKRRVLKVIELVSQNKIEEASRNMNATLRLDPTNSYLQFFNGFVYQVMGKNGDTQKYELAEQGYKLAKQFDKTNWISNYFLSLFYIDQRNYASAKAELAEVLLFRADDKDVLLRMVAVSYYAKDTQTASACLDHLRAISPTNPQVLRFSAIISAALGQTDKSNQWLSLYQDSRPPSEELNLTKESIHHWNLYYAKNPIPKSLDQTLPVNDLTGEDLDLRIDSANAGLNAKRSLNPRLIQVQTPAPAAPAGPVPTVADSVNKKMILVDVVIMTTEDTYTTNRGVNMLQGLQLQFGSASATAFSRASSTVNGAATTTITRAINVPALTYAMNLVNSNTNVDEVLARPTLTALEGVKSEFFSGTDITAAVVSTGAAGSSSGAIQIQKSIGVKLGITPVFLPDNSIRLGVDVERTFLQPASGSVQFTYKLQTSNIRFSVNLIMRLGETLVLGGLSEKEVARTRDGVPILQDTPLLQYFFSNQTTSSFQRSVLLLITPRAPEFTYRSDEALLSENGGGDDPESLKELRARYGDWFKPYPNMASVFHHIEYSNLYREFRTGDVTLEQWDKLDTTFSRLKQALGYIFY